MSQPGPTPFEPSPVQVENADSAVLADEANHRIANNFATTSALLHTQANELRKSGGQFSGAEVATILEEARSRIDVAGHLHRLLAETHGAAVELGDYLGQIGENVVAALGRADQIHLELHCERGLALPPALTFDLALVAVELLTNAIKYSHPASQAATQIELGCARRGDDAIALWVSDDGVGMPDDFDLAHDGGLGLRIVRLLAEKHRCALDFNSHGLGLCVTLTVRLPG